MVAGAAHLSVGGMTAAVIVTVVVYWLAESYARYLAERVVHPGHEAVVEAVHHAGALADGDGDVPAAGRAAAGVADGRR
jgi:hypothetical protein